MFYKESNGEQGDYFCGGSLITNVLVVTGKCKKSVMYNLIIYYSSQLAAHCVWPKYQIPTVKENILVILGANNFSDPLESGRLIRNVEEIFIHVNWKPKKLDFTDDLAIVKLDSEVVLSEFIQPIGLIADSTNYIEKGKVVGWGSFDDTETPSEVAKELNLKLFNQGQCFRHDYLLAIIAWEDCFCAGSESGAVCRGDSGSGLFVQINGISYLKGVVSSTIGRNCSENVKRNCLYTDMARYFEFVSVNIL